MGSLSSLHQWWQHLSSDGPNFGYFPNVFKTVLIVKPKHLAAAESVFASTNIQIVAQGQQHLGAALGACSFTEAYVTQKVVTWTVEISALTSVTTTSSPVRLIVPSLMKCLVTGYNNYYVMRTIPDIGLLFKTLKDAIYLKLISSNM